MYVRFLLPFAIYDKKWWLGLRSDWTRNQCASSMLDSNPYCAVRFLAKELGKHPYSFLKVSYPMPDDVFRTTANKRSLLNANAKSKSE